MKEYKMAKKTPTMLKRLKKKLKKEDILKYGTPDEIKLFEGFEEEHGIEGTDEEAEEMGGDIEVEGMEDEGMAKDIPVSEDVVEVPLTLLEDIYELLLDAEAPDNILDELGSLLSPQGDEDEIEQTSNRGQDDGEVTLDNDFDFAGKEDETL
jgi:hypothetical protein